MVKNNKKNEFSNQLSQLKAQLFQLEKDYLKLEDQNSEVSLEKIKKDYSNSLKKVKYGIFSKDNEEFLYQAYLQWQLNQDNEAYTLIDNLLKTQCSASFNVFDDKCTSFQKAFNKYSKFENFVNYFVAHELTFYLKECVSLDSFNEIMDNDTYQGQGTQEINDVFFEMYDRSVFLPCTSSYFLNYLSENRKTPKAQLTKFTTLFESLVEKANSTLGLDAAKTSEVQTAISKAQQQAYALIIDKNDPISNKVIRGMPGGVAYKIALSYLYGYKLSLDKEKAKAWLLYGMGVGDLNCAMTYLLCFASLNFEDFSLSDQAFYEFQAVFLACICQQIQYIINPIYKQAFGTLDNESKIQANIDNCAFNLLSLYSALIIAFDSGSVTNELKTVQNMFSDPNLFLFAILNVLDRPSDKLVSACALYIDVEKLVSDPRGIEYFFIHQKFKSNSKKSVELNLLKLIEQGAKNGDLYSVKSYCRMFSRAGLGSLENVNPKYLDILSKNHCSEATFVKGNFALNSNQGDAKAIELWKIAATDGDVYSLFNLALNSFINSNYDKATEYANNALCNNLIYAYHILYRVYQKQNSQLSCTYLRYASEYFFPDAISELKILKGRGDYKPLPFMQKLEQLESIAEFDSQACLILFTLYMNGQIVPTNQARAFEYLGKSVALGNTEYLPLYQDMYRSFFGPDRDKNPVLVTLTTSMQMEQGFLDSSESRTRNNKVVSEDLFISLVKDLKEGKTQLEQELFYGFYKSNLWDTLVGNKLKVSAQKVHKPKRFKLDSLKQMLLAKFLEDYEDPKNFINLQMRVEDLTNLNADNTLDGNLVTSLLSLRSLSVAPLYSIYKCYMQRAANSGFKSAIILDSLDFDFVFKQKVLNLNEAKACLEDKIEKTSESTKVDVFISNVTQ